MASFAIWNLLSKLQGIWITKFEMNMYIRCEEQEKREKLSERIHLENKDEDGGVMLKLKSRK